ncbi:MAG: 2-oxoacid:ferredoxin oxidoreductase subunit alpha [Candidatus Moraniibacteriota bacterium]|nr:MAG: 2-oxoacid:ferredoxin oxidoreductase subunit alpha [Candidatus Moranbacteria bacterium]
MEDFSIVIAGQAGQGVQSVAHILTHILKRQGYHVFATKEYMSRVRGGMNSTTIRVSSTKRDAYVSRVDLFVALDVGGYEHVKKRFNEETLFLGFRDEEFCADCIMEIDFVNIAQAIGNRIFANTVAAGAILGLMGIDQTEGDAYLREFFIKKGEDIIIKNQQAFVKGYKMGEHFAFTEDISIDITSEEDVKDDLFISGTDAVGLGALAAGCDFCSSYPMSPSTGVLTFMAQHGKDCGVIVEQATDEIGAINMSLGASYAGARPIITTSGGGFALMCEAISLSGMTETPVTVHIAQRPGPATGLPTRTGQEDLDLVLHAGHGEFMRAVFAPGTAIEAYDITAHAMYVADKYQIPTFVLTDQYFVDALFTADKEEFLAHDINKSIIESDRQYKRYALTENGISPRSVPGYGDGLVCVDSDEHDENGHITEDMDGLRKQMTDKRLFKRRELLEETAIEPEIIGKKSAKTMVVCWGSNRNVLVESIENLNNSEISVIHFAQLFPFNKSVKKTLGKAEKVIVVENNAIGQFANLLEKECGVTVNRRILKWNGEPFSVEELTNEIKKIAK